MSRSLIHILLSFHPGDLFFMICSASLPVYQFSCRPTPRRHNSCFELLQHHQCNSNNKQTICTIIIHRSVPSSRDITLSSQGQVTPPFVPKLEGENDTSCFDSEFTDESANITQIVLRSNEVKQCETCFREFSFTAKSFRKSI